MSKNTGKISQLVNGVKAQTHKIAKDVATYKQERPPEARAKGAKQGISNR